MECIIKLCLTSSEITRARSFGIEVEVGSQDDTNSWNITGTCSSVTKALNFLRTIRDLRDYSNEELEEYYIRAVE